MIPKTINICGIDYRIILSPSVSGGVTDLTDKTISIGTASKKDILNILFHEIGEAILHERGLRYTRYEEGNDGVRFILTHHEYENVIADLLVVSKQLRGVKF